MTVCLPTCDSLLPVLTLLVTSHHQPTRSSRIWITSCLTQSHLIRSSHHPVQCGNPSTCCNVADHLLPVPHYLPQQSPSEPEIYPLDTILLSTNRRCAGLYDQSIHVSGTWDCGSMKNHYPRRPPSEPGIHPLDTIFLSNNRRRVGLYDQGIHVSGTWDRGSTEEPLFSTLTSELGTSSSDTILPSTNRRRVGLYAQGVHCS